MSPRYLASAGCLATALLLLTGCGTINNFQMSSPTGRPRIFGGVRENAEFFVNQDVPFLGLVCLIDAPLSLVGDVLTLPWVIKATRAVKR